MATLLKPDKLKVTDYDKKLKRIRTITNLTRDLQEQNAKLATDLEAATTDYDKAIIQKEIDANNHEIDILNKEEKIIISRTKSRQEVLEDFKKDYEDKKGFKPSNKVIKDYMESQGYFAEGGRINKQMGGGFDMAQEPQAVSQEPQMAQPEQLQEDPYMVLRKRLPPEIPNEVVQLIAYNKEAFEDFANIQTQDDVDLFNQKYNVQLVVDMASA